MVFSLTSMIRFMVVLAVASTLLAIGVSRFDPPQPIRRFPRTVTNFNINECYLQGENRKSCWLDSETGSTSETPLVADDVLETASCSPWVDESGRRQVIGRWSNRTWEGANTLCREFGLARYSFPDGKIIDQVACDTVPTTPPCWFPGTQARVLFAAGDGRLYRFDFEAADSVALSTSSQKPVDHEPSLIPWSCPRPGGGDVYVSDVSWPKDPRMQGRLITSMRVHERDEHGRLTYSRTKLWWLQLDASSSAIIEAGPLIEHDISGPRVIQIEERSPIIGVMPNGSLCLAYCRQIDGGPGWSICLTTLPTATDGRSATAVESQVRVVAKRNHLAQLAFSGDGKWLNVLGSGLGSDEVIERISTDAKTPPQAVASR